MVFTVIIAFVHLDLEVLIVKQVGAHISFDSSFFVSLLLLQVFLVIPYLSPLSYQNSQTNILFC